MSILNNSLRIGCFTSSEIVALTRVDAKGNFLSAALTYIDDCNLERRLGRPLDKECNARALLWGLALEPIVFNKINTTYTHRSQETIQHPRIPFWAGSADGLKHDDGMTVYDFKCPFTLKSFCDLVKPLYDGLNGIEAIEWVRYNHKAGPTYYWQLVSNAILNDCKHAELIVYMPYESEIAEIKETVQCDPRYGFIGWAADGELPYLPDGGYYKNINTIRFSVPDADKLFLIEQVQKAGKLLINL